MSPEYYLLQHEYIFNNKDITDIGFVPAVGTGVQDKVIILDHTPQRMLQLTTYTDGVLVFSEHNLSNDTVKIKSNVELVSVDPT